MTPVVSAVLVEYGSLISRPGVAPEIIVSVILIVSVLGVDPSQLTTFSLTGIVPLYLKTLVPSTLIGGCARLRFPIDVQRLTTEVAALPPEDWDGNRGSRGAQLHEFASLHWYVSITVVVAGAGFAAGGVPILFLVFDCPPPGW